MVGNRRIVIVRHGERVDFLFTDEWFKSCFVDGVYKKQNLNMPDSIPKREGSPKTFLRDCPLTQVGVCQAEMTGKGLRDENILRDGFEVYVSPALRSVQTAAGIAKGMGVDFRLNVEPCLFEWTGWFSDFMPKWMTVPEFSENGYNVDSSYIPFKSSLEIKQDEALNEFYDRTHHFVLHLLSKSDKDLLLVAHGATPDAAIRQLSGEPIRNLSAMIKLVRNVPYCGVAVAENSQESDKWSVISTPRITMRHSGVEDFDAVKALSCEQCLVPELSTNPHM